MKPQTEADLRDRLRKIESLFAGAGTDGERQAAGAARARVKDRLEQMKRREAEVELAFAMPDQWSRQLFVALCRRYGLSPFRYRRQRRTTVMVRVPRSFVDTVLLPEFQKLNDALVSYLKDVTTRVIHAEVYRDVSEAPELDGAPALTGPLAQSPADT